MAEPAPGRDPASLAARPAVLIIGVGNALRHDDAAGLEVARRLRARTTAADGAAIAEHAAIGVLEHEGEPLGLLERWQGARAAVLVDAVRSGAAPGTIHRVDVSREPFPAQLRGVASTHAVGLDEALELARALHRLPERVLLYGLEGVCFDAGSGLSPEVGGVIDSLATIVLRSAHQLAASGESSR